MKCIIIAISLLLTISCDLFCPNYKNDDNDFPTLIDDIGEGGIVNSSSYDKEYLYELPFGEDESYTLSQGYNGGFSHYGNDKNALDFDLPEGTKLYAIRGGIVSKLENSYSGSTYPDKKVYGNYVVIRHVDGTRTLYAHLEQDSIVVSLGDEIVKGQYIANSGDTGYSTGAHLHIRIDNGESSIPTSFIIEDKIISGDNLKSGIAYKKSIQKYPKVIKTFGRQGYQDGEFSNPYDIAILSDNNIIITDMGNHAIKEFDICGNLKNVISYKDYPIISYPQGVSSDSDNKIYITLNGSGKQILRGSNSVYSVFIDDKGYSEGQLMSPVSIYAEQDGCILIVDNYNNTVNKYTNSGIYLFDLLKDIKKIYPMVKPYSIVGKDGYYYFVDAENANIYKLNNIGTLISKWGYKGSSSDGWTISRPTKIAYYKEKLYIIDESLDIINVFDTNGKYLYYFDYKKIGLINNFELIRSIAFDKIYGYMFIIDNNYIHKIQLP